MAAKTTGPGLWRFCFHAAFLLGNCVLPNRERDVHDQRKITRRWNIPLHVVRATPSTNLLISAPLGSQEMKHLARSFRVASMHA